MKLLPTNLPPDNRTWGQVFGLATRPASENIEKGLRGIAGVMVVRDGRLLPGLRGAEIVTTDETGSFAFRLLPTASCAMGNPRRISLAAFRVNALSGLVEQAADRGVGGRVYPTEFVLNEAQKGTALPMFDCRSIAILNCFDPRTFAPLQPPRIYSGAGEESLRIFGLHLALSEREASVVCFVPPRESVRLIFPGGIFLRA